MTAFGDASELIARLQQASEELDQMAAAQQAELDQARAAWAEEDAERAKQARSGELGPAWQRLQGRIDLGETSVSAVLRGADDSVAAAEVREHGQRNAEEFGRALQVELEQEAEDATDGTPELFAGMAAEVAQLQAVLDELAAMTGTAPPPDRPTG